MGLERRRCVVRPWPLANWKREEPVGEAKPFNATAEHREPCDSRGSCTVLGAPGGEIPSGDSTRAAVVARLMVRPVCPQLRKCRGRPAVTLGANKRHYRWMGKTKLRREAAVFAPVRSVLLTLNSNCPLSAPISAGGARADRGVSHRSGCDCRVHSLPRGMGRVWIEHEQRQPQLSLGVRVQGNSGDTARRKHPGGNFGRLRFWQGFRGRRHGPRDFAG